MIEAEVLVVKPRLATVLSLVSPPLVALALIIYLMLRDRSASAQDLEVLSFAGVTLVAFLLFTGGWKLVVDRNGVTLSSIVFKRTLLRDEIAYATVVPSSALRPALVLRIVPKEGSKKKPISISYKLLARKDRERILNAINGTESSLA